MTDARALAPMPTVAPVVTRDQLDLIKRTVAVGGTDAELALFLYDCQRRGVHPLDRMLHFTKRSGRYTPITSIDFLRTRAADTGEMAGSDDPVFALVDKDSDRTATVTVYRLTRGARYGYTATARYAEYVPAAGQDHMWKKMPHTMLGKCAEALALRKAFPQQLAGLYVKEELEQARPDFTTAATSIADQYAVPPVASLPPEADPDADDARASHDVAVDVTAARLARLAPGVVVITNVDAAPTKNPNVIRTTVTVAGGPSWPAAQTKLTTINERLAAAVESAWARNQAVAITVTKGKFSYELATIEDARESSAPVGPPPDAESEVSDRDDPPF